MHPNAMPVWGHYVPPAEPFRPSGKMVDPSKFPPFYKMYVVGTCLQQLVPDGSWLAFDRSEEPAPLGLVAIYLAPRMVGLEWPLQAIVKRLVRPFPPGTRLGGPATLKGREGAPRMIVEQINPFRQYAIWPDQVLGVHACVGLTRFEANDYQWDDEQAVIKEGRRHA